MPGGWKPADRHARRADHGPHRIVVPEVHLGRDRLADAGRDPGDDREEGTGSYLDKRSPNFAPWDPGIPAEPAPLPD
jgi:hypothetical protein